MKRPVEKATIDLSLPPQVMRNNAAKVNLFGVGFDPASDASTDDLATCASCMINIAKSLAFEGIHTAQDRENVFHAIHALLNIAAGCVEVISVESESVAHEVAAEAA